ncbi:hypothetical protein H9P43_008093 [Blastocladiella emersonii ATCC 22665]|nr:hypothetical protein H9P43_008093 [Blastocladiella emersonii ATCC 22665]
MAAVPPITSPTRARDPADALSPSAKRRRTGPPSSAVGSPVLGSPVSAVSTLPDTAATEQLNDAALARRWQKTIEHTVPSVVSVSFMCPVPFDTEPAIISQATGFIVDAERGIILTNRHVVGPGPFVGTIICHDHEEVDAIPIYRDPIHDFGFLKFDPSKIKYMPVRAIPLRPDLARVGLDIRVCGNDAGEKLSILAGSISRLDRNTPDYGELTYNDFNTSYIQAASSSSGGSSGSPVIDLGGNAVALQAGGATQAATNFFFPLDRVVRALELLQKCHDEDAYPTVPRGTILTRWLLRPYDEARRFGLRPETEAAVRAHDSTEIGMLVVDGVVPDSVAHGKLEEGDILVKCNGQIITKFVPLEALLDEHIGGELTFDVERGGTPISVRIPVADLHAVTPDTFVEVGGAKFNNLSYQLARFYGVPARGVYVAQAGGAFRFVGYSHGLIVDAIDSKPVANLDDMVAILQRIPDGARIPVTFYSIADVHVKSVSIVTMDKTWAPFRKAVRNDRTGLWDYTDLNVVSVPREELKVQNAVMPEYSLGPVAGLMRSVVKVSASFPLVLDGFPKSRRAGFGLVVDADLGLVLVSRAHIPQDVCILEVAFWDSVEVPAKVVFVHPIQNYAIVQYDAKLVTGPVTSAPIDPDTPVVVPGQKVDFLAMTDSQRPIHVATTVTDLTLMVVPPSGEPRARAINFEGITLDSPVASTCMSGFLADPASGKVVAMWMTFLGEHNNNSGQDMEYAMGLPMADIYPQLSRVVAKVRELTTAGTPVTYPLPSLGLHALDAEFSQVLLVKARAMGVPESWIERIHAKKFWHVLLVKRIAAGSACDGVLRELDLVLAIDGHVVSSVRDVARLTTFAAEPLVLDVVRNKQVIQVTVSPTPLETGTARAVVWAGALIQAPHLAVRQQIRRLPSGCYVAARREGSPATMYGLSPTMFITHINDRATPDLDAFLAAVDGIADGTYVRVKLVSFDFVPCVISVKLCLHYFPTLELRRVPGSENGWEKAPKAVQADVSTVPPSPADEDAGNGVAPDADEPMDQE